MLRLVVRPEAEADIAEAAVWYESRSFGLGKEFARTVDASLNEILATPERFPRVLGDTRRALLHRFPYALFYRTRGETLEVLACMHTRRDPRRWR